MTLEARHQLLHYQLIEKIGEGGMGVVWKALDTSLDREVAIKVLPEALASDALWLARFEREAKLLASLNTRTSPPSSEFTKTTAHVFSPWSSCQAKISPSD